MLDAAQDVNTANGFQGAERDLIIFVMGLIGNTSKGERWYVEAAENQYIFNVAVSRARACLIVVGDREQALKSQSAALRKLADIEKRRPETLSQSPGEELLFRALSAAGFVPQQQYPLASRYLDMALVNEKIDIEVDGEAYHLNRYGERKQDDIYRDLQVQSNGWRVCRFWYREVRDDVAGCVAKVRELTGT
jgi:very-short-patch-repair endonuclease